MADGKMESFFTGKVNSIKWRKDETPIPFSFIRGLFGWPSSSLFSIENASESEKNSPDSSWEDLPEDLLQEIVLKLDICQFIRMGAVCQSWHAAINSSQYTRRLLQISVNSQIPWLLQEHSPSTDLIHLYSFSQGKRFNFLKPKFNSWIRDSFCCGTTSNGWLIMADGFFFDPSMFLWNPLSGKTISLPSLSAIPNYRKSYDMFDHLIIPNYFKRVEVFSVSSGDTDHVVVAAIFGLLPNVGGYGQTLILCTPEEEDDEWTVIESDRERELYFDILHHNGMLYVVKNVFKNEESKDGTFEVCTIGLANCEVNLGFIHALPYPERVMGDFGDEVNRVWPNDLGVAPVIQFMGWLHLAKSIHGELLLITRTLLLLGYFDGAHTSENIRRVHYETRHFKVQVIKFENDKSLFTLTSCTSLGNQALFVGSSGAVASVSEFDQDCIWFLPSEHHIHDVLVSKDSGVFYVRDKTIKRCFPSMKAPLPSKLGWFTPKLL